MLMLTKKIGSPVQLLFFDWRLLENYNLYLDDINLPAASLDTLEEFPKIFTELKKKYLENFNKKEDFEGNLIWEGTQTKLKENIINSVDKCTLSTEFTEILFKDFTDIKESHGTRFLIFEPIDQILDLSESNKEDDRENRDFIISSLSGFFNPFLKIDSKKRIKTHFYIHEDTGRDKDIFVEEGNFFTSDDYDLADILIEGNFDGYGKFKGKLKIFEETIPYEFEPTRRKFAKKYYGDFYIKLGYSQGKLIDSKLNDTAWKKINDKVKKNGGLYIFRDNFRVLPYGRPNADFLKFEERRNRRIGSYFFSYRRMFGYIGITRNKNGDYLKDKSSREGLINSDPYIAFESDLISFFIQIAKDYFSDKAEKSIFLDEKKKLNEQHQAISDDKKRETEEKKSFSRGLSSYPSKFNEYEKQYQNLLRQLDEKINLTQTTYNDIENILVELHQMDLEFEKLLPEIPKRYKPTDLQLDRLNQYEEQIIVFNRNVKDNTIELMQKVNEKLELHDLKINFTKNAEAYKNQLENLISEYSNILTNKLNSLAIEYKDRAGTIIKDFNNLKQSASDNILTKNDIIKQSEFLKLEFEKQKDLTNKTLIPLAVHINNMSFDIDEELLQGAYKEQFEQMKQQWSMVQDTAQLGIAVEIIDHEFNVLYSRINRLLDNLDNISAFNENSEYRLLEKTFRSLEDKYDLLSPLYRIHGGITKDIQCSTALLYVENFFGKQLKDENIKLSATSSFLKHIIKIKEPTLYTVMINIVNNAIYWVRNSEKKEIIFDYFKNTNEILILNSGKKIEEHRLNKIFDLFYSNRPTGRGIGLYLAKQSLNENYFNIEATNNENYNYLNGACFIINQITN